ncbi:hypothetical protein LV457_08620 [Mycobacterium sp. MYCO198283]|uniref:hypothetical protein n=1 Tax=Mycobacterium sp. MYCO198283 TaxID=2883505 RepID=UPI001E64C656|nr:hypothetical protein [Mycobacterium sp. MYCO198283]MCG5432356.1 hypothetical protein [Mycobacterium sp. MYCO198283]
MTAVRAVLLVAGLALGGYGAALLVDHPPAVLGTVAVWALAGLLVHDALLAPLWSALGWAGRRILPRGWWAPVGVGALCTVVLVLLAVPVFDRPGARPTNPTVLDRDYPAGLGWALAAVWGGVVAAVAVSRRLPVGEDQAVEQQRADDVERQPPPV